MGHTENGSAERNRKAEVDIPSSAPTLPFVVKSEYNYTPKGGISKFILSLSGFRYCGEMGCDFFSRDTWIKKLEEHDVHVMTAQIFLHIVTSGFITMSQINLIVI
ncbi:hypothetical protein HDU93_003466, partial [Gonapodya sp. JEL0774]